MVCPSVFVIERLACGLGVTMRYTAPAESCAMYSSPASSSPKLEIELPVPMGGLDAQVPALSVAWKISPVQ